jgi:ABC-type thiamin/hydroxymethylpyrimidine transport system permease subunit
VKYTVRDLVYVGVFAGCWGAIEITLGALLHTLRVPFLGAVMAGAGIAIALVGRLYVPKTGSIALIALVTALLKLLSVGGIVLSPMIAIIGEGLVAEVCVLVLGSGRVGFVVAASAAASWSLAHAFLRVWLTGGMDLLGSYVVIVERGAGTVGLPPSSGGAILAVLVAVHVAIGAVAGLLAWRVGQGLRRRGRHWGGASR